MDAWLPEIMEKDKQGTSLLIVRTETSERFHDSARLMQVVELQVMPSTKLIQSQGTQRLLNKDLPVFLFLNRIFGQHAPSYDLKLPRPEPLNWQRAVLVYWNTWISSKAFMNRFVPLLARIEPRHNHRHWTNKDLRFPQTEMIKRSRIKYLNQKHERIRVIIPFHYYWICYRFFGTTALRLGGI